MTKKSERTITIIVNRSSCVKTACVQALFPPERLLLILGGIPYYFGYFEPGLSLAQNIDRLFFEKQAKLRDEYNRLFTSVFESPEYMKKLVSLLSRKSRGYTRKEMIGLSEALSEGSRLTEALRALVAGDFVIRYIPFGCSGREIHYRLSDPFIIFWQHFISDRRIHSTNLWQSLQESPRGNTWNGLAFERVCFLHIGQIKRKLGISLKCQSSSPAPVWYNR